MKKQCIQCSADYVVSDIELQFLEEVSPVFNGKKELIPPPILCPNCRQQRRVAQANQIHLYKRMCDKTGKPMITNYHPDDPYTVYDQEVWYSDTWSALDYGREFDFNRSFFEQLHELYTTVPRPNLQTGYQYDENSDYTNYAGKNKNCYLVFDSDENWDCYYSYSINNSRSCMDCYRVRSSELCYQAIDCTKCYNCQYIQDCDNCTESMFLKNCIGCKHCLLCSNLQNKEYYVENKQVSPEQFKEYKQALRTQANLEAAKQRFAALCLQFPQKAMHGILNEGSFGDYLDNSKNARSCFDSSQLWDCTYVYQAFMPLKNCIDIQECGDGEQMYECAFMGYSSYHNLFSMFTLADCADLLYCINCPHSKHCFGCVGIQSKEYCVFNKQYSKEEYEELVPRIIEQMRKTPYETICHGEVDGLSFVARSASAPLAPQDDKPAHEPSNCISEWGQFFPISFSLFPYNLTLAQEQFLLTKEQALERGYSWRENDTNEHQPSTYVVPNSIDQVSDDVLQATLACSQSGKNYRVTKQELALLRQFDAPLPTECFEVRHHARRAMRNGRTLHKRQCAKTGADMWTTYSPEGPHIVYSEEAYRESLL